MAITLGAEIALAIHLDNALTYGEIEDAVVGAGFTSYTIMRNLNYDSSSDVQLFVRSVTASDGSTEPLPAADTLTKLSTALATLESTQDGGDTPAPE
jgi:hypothetical protein